MYKVSFYNNIIFVNYYSLVIVSLIIIVFYCVSHIVNTLHKHNIILLAIFGTVKVFSIISYKYNIGSTKKNSANDKSYILSFYMENNHNF